MGRNKDKISVFKTKNYKGVCKMKVKFLLINVYVLFAIGILATSGYAKIDPNTCVGMWLFDEGKGDTAKDLSGNKYDGTLLNSPKWIDGKFGKALNFEGVDDCVSIPNKSALLEQQFTQMTMMAYVYPTAFGGGTYGHTIISRTDGDGWSLRINNGLLLADLRLTGGNVTASIPPTKIAANTWSHIAVTYDNTKGIILGYINGNNIGELKGSGNIKNAGNAATCTFIGTDPATCKPQGPEFDFTGSIDEVAMFSVALTEDDIKSISSKGLGVTMGIAPVDASSKLTTTWANIKAR